VRDRVVELPEPHVCGAEVRQRIRPIGFESQRGLVGLDGAERVAGLLQFEGTREQLLEVLGGWGLRPRRAGHQKKHERKEGEPGHGMPECTSIVTGHPRGWSATYRTPWRAHKQREGESHRLSPSRMFRSVRLQIRRGLKTPAYILAGSGSPAWAGLKARPYVC
jgi:hypothetical protein